MQLFTAGNSWSGNVWVIGEINNDGNLDIFDVLLTLEYILEYQQPEQCEQEVADFNDDNTINILDVVNLVGHIMGM